MLKVFRSIAYFVLLCIILNVLSFFVVKIQILTPAEQLQLRQGKTFWPWNMHNGETADIHYTEKGTGSNHIVLIHGFRSNTFTWRHLEDPLAQAGFHVWSIDLLGYGFSDKPNVNYNFDLFTDQINAFIENHDISKAHFIGNSMGGGLGLNLALRYPEKIHSLILISALGYPLDLPFHVLASKYFSTLLGPFTGPSIIRSGLEQIVYQKDSVSDEQVHAYTIPYYLPGGFEATLSTIKNFDNQQVAEISKRYSEIQCPLLIIWGEKDPLIPIDHFNQFRHDFPTAQTLLIAECGHIPQEEKPEQTLNTILSFMHSLTPLTQNYKSN